MRRQSFWLAALTIVVLAIVASAQGVFDPRRDVTFFEQFTFARSSNPICFEGSTDDENETCLTFTDPTADRTVTVPNATTTLVGTDTTQTLTNKTLTAPAIGAATGTSLAVTGTITSSSASAKIGYATGAGCSVTQTTNRSTGVTCTGASGAITTDATSLAAGAEATFTVTNSSVAVGDAVIVSARSGQTADTSVPIVTTVAAGSFNITLTNLHASTADTGAMIINFAVIKAVSS